MFPLEVDKVEHVDLIDIGSVKLCFVKEQVETGTIKSDDEKL